LRLSPSRTRRDSTTLLRLRSISDDAGLELGAQVGVRGP
jgi:hypothetical protein